MKPVHKKATAGLLAGMAVFVAGWEGTRTVAYPDLGGVWTICNGETKNVHRGDIASPAECRAMLASRLQEFDAGVSACIKPDLPDKRRIAFDSMAYNVGVSGFCGSTTARKINAGDVRGACNAMLAWNKVAGIPIPGLTRRRQAERALCLEGL